MTGPLAYPKRLIEVDLPIARISAHARREKSIRHGHISTLHIWWARRPLAACRAVIFAALWPGPGSMRSALPDSGRMPSESSPTLKTRVLEGGISPDQRDAFASVSRMSFPEGRGRPDWAQEVSSRLHRRLRELGQFDRPGVSGDEPGATQAAHEALGGAPGTRPLVVDPFAGGGSDSTGGASRRGVMRLPVTSTPCQCCSIRSVLEYIPKHGESAGRRGPRSGVIGSIGEAGKELSESSIRKTRTAAMLIAYLWARTIPL